jgi:two-component system, cell cycle sensor histidine kinase and response regulator CckA
MSTAEKILVVDDEPQVLVALEDLLGDDYVVLKTESPEDALQLMQQDPDIAVVMTDQRMPKMTGDELLSRVGDSSDARRILVTGFADLSAVIRAVNDGKIFAYVTKPWNSQDLRTKVGQAVDHFRLAKQLAHERRLLLDLMDNSPDGIYFKDHSLRFERVNRAWAHSLGVDEVSSLLGKRLDEVVAPFEDVSDVMTEEQRMLGDGKPAIDVVRRRLSAGRPAWISETKAPIRGGSGEVIGLVGIARDVTERIAAENALRKSEERYRNQSHVLNSILESMGEGLIVADSGGRFLLVNRQAEAVLGMSIQGHTSANWTLSFGIYQADRKTPLTPAEDPLVLAMQGRTTAEMQLFIRNAKVSGTDVAVSAAPLIGSDNRVAGGVMVLRDVTAQLRLEQQLTQSQKMEAIGRLAGGIAHDFSNLLAVIQGYGELLLQRLDEQDPNRGDMQEILEATYRAGTLTRQLLAFSRRRLVQPKVLDLNSVVENVEKMLRRVIGEDVQLTTQLDPQLGKVKADTAQIEQVLLNLTINARDAMAHGGTISVRTANVLFSPVESSDPATPHVLLAVRDTGSGMDDETQRQMFEPFFTTKEVGRGTGLGLSTVYGIVQQGNGSIVVDSEIGHGTELKIYLPRVDATNDDVQPERVSLPTGGVGTILLVEDDDAVRAVAARILTAQGYVVLETGDVAEARAWCKDPQRKIDLLLTDVVMPVLNGPQLAQELSAMRPDLRVLFMSGYAGGASVREGFLEGQEAFIEKPFSPSSLALKVREVLGLENGAAQASR